ncbi:MAG: TIGR03905 family TSCPD domain-containing protein [Clostridia bacterium]|nr:TIGR03905 family TSCPD domain-containing protein [Clostridia bacterium]
MVTYKTRGTCAREIQIETDGDIVTHVNFVGGCAGNTVGVARLAEGRKIDDVIACCKGIPCRSGTSCPDQLARALEEIKLSKGA